MQHRHLNPGYEDTVEAVEDVLERGSVEDWRELARKVRQDAHGPAARALRTVLEHRYMYGTTVIWKRFLERLEGKTARPDMIGDDSNKAEEHRF